MLSDKKKWKLQKEKEKKKYYLEQKAKVHRPDFVIKTGDKFKTFDIKTKVGKSLNELQKSLIKIQQGTEPIRNFIEQNQVSTFRKELEIQKSINRELRSVRGILGLYLNEEFKKKANVKPSELSFLGDLQRTKYVPQTPKPVGHKREALTGAGMRRFMELSKIDNPVLIAKIFPKNQKALQIAGFINLRFLCEAMNVSANEAFLYICEGMTKTNKRWLKHRIEKEYWRGSISIINLVKYYKEKVQQYKAKGLAKYTIKSLFKSPYLLQFCTEHQIKFKSYPDFTRHFKKWKHHVEVLEKSKPKGLLN